MGRKKKQRINTFMYYSERDSRAFILGIFFFFCFVFSLPKMLVLMTSFFRRSGHLYIIIIIAHRTRTYNPVPERNPFSVLIPAKPSNRIGRDQLRECVSIAVTFSWCWGRGGGFTRADFRCAAFPLGPFVPVSP